jgi:hypothetical protein
LAGMGKVPNGLDPGFRFQITDGSGCHARKFGGRPLMRQPGASQHSVFLAPRQLSERWANRK